MIQALTGQLWDKNLNYPLIARDAGGELSGIASDGLHLLAYLDPGDLLPERLEAICQGARALETPYGFRTYAPGQLDYSAAAYHWGAIWPFEQFFLAQGVLLHGREELLPVTLRAIEALQELGFVELFYWDEPSGLRGPGEIPGEGCALQLWSAAYPAAMHRLLGQPCGEPGTRKGGS
jgi:glycogen debranching enzyme